MAITVLTPWFPGPVAGDGSVHSGTDVSLQRGLPLPHASKMGQVELGGCKGQRSVSRSVSQCSLPSTYMSSPGHPSSLGVASPSRPLSPAAPAAAPALQTPPLCQLPLPLPHDQSEPSPACHVNSLYHYLMTRVSLVQHVMSTPSTTIS